MRVVFGQRIKVRIFINVLLGSSKKLSVLVFHMTIIHKFSRFLPASVCFQTMLYLVCCLVSPFAVVALYNCQSARSLHSLPSVCEVV